jgi:hypothetical protein
MSAVRACSTLHVVLGLRAPRSRQHGTVSTVYATGGNIMATKEAYRQQLEARLAQWDARLDLLAAKARKATADAQIDHENELGALRRQREHAVATMTELAKRSEGAWDDVKVGAERAWDEMGKTIDRLAARFR